MTEIKNDYKSRMFTMLFSDKKELLRLYNAVANRNYENPELLEINTLENAIYMSMYNDLSFIIDMRLNLYEHQSTYNPNLPLRFLMYLSDLYSKITSSANLYGRKLTKIPTPRFIVFYNGVEARPEREILRLSEAFEIDDEEKTLELVVEVINVNAGYNQDVMKACKTLADYADFVQRIREYKEKGMTIAEAVDVVIEECIKENILKEFLIRNRSEARAVSIYEYNQEEHMRMEREQNFADGREEGHAEGRVLEMVRLCREFGKDEDYILERLMREFDLEEESALAYMKG